MISRIKQLEYILASSEVTSTYSSTMRDLNKENNINKTIQFMKAFKEAFDNAMEEGDENHQEVALLEAKRKTASNYRLIELTKLSNFNSPVRFSRVSGNIYRGGEPNDDSLEALADVFKINTILSLDGEIGQKISNKVKELGMNHVIIPIGGIESIEMVRRLQDSVSSILNNNQPVYVHCRHGSDRTGMAIAIYRIQSENWSPQKALVEAKSFGFGNLLGPNTEKFYTEAILGMSKKAEEDIVGAMRDTFDMGRAAPAYLPQQSFAPKDDIKYTPPQNSDNIPVGFKDPMHTPNKMPTSQEQLKKEKKKLLEEALPIPLPLTGLYDNVSGPRGKGPGTETGGMQYAEEGSGVPGGAGVGGVETGGLLGL